MRQPTFLDILQTAEQMAVEEQSYEVARALRSYPVEASPGDRKRRDQLIDRAYFKLSARCHLRENA